MCVSERMPMWWTVLISGVPWRGERALGKIDRRDHPRVAHAALHHRVIELPPRNPLQANRLQLVSWELTGVEVAGEKEIRAHGEILGPRANLAEVEQMLRAIPELLLQLAVGRLRRGLAWL